MPNTTPPPWLKALNNSALPVAHNEQAEAPSPAPDEYVEPLFQYEAPPPLQLSQAPDAPQPDTVIESNSTALPFTFNAADFEEAIKSPTGKAFDMEQEWPVFGFNVPADLPPGIHTAKLDKPIAPIAVPADWNQPVEPVVNDPVPVKAPWLAKMSTPDVIAFDNHIQAVLKVNPAHAAILLRLRVGRRLMSVSSIRRRRLNNILKSAMAKRSRLADGRMLINKQLKKRKPCLVRSSHGSASKR